MLWLGVVLFATLCCSAALTAGALNLSDQTMVSLAEQRYGNFGKHAVIQWQALLQEITPLATDQKLRRVNDFFNRRIRYVDDRLTWKVADYWATPLETLGLGQGDCEDFSFAKYVTLNLAGVPASKLRLTYVKAKLTTAGKTEYQAHMVLGYYPTPTSQPLILDNLNPRILAAGKRKDLLPVFSFNTENLWVRNKTQAVGGSLARLSNWRDVLQRMNEEGIN